MGTQKVYLPKWMARFGTVMAVGMWILVTYMTFSSDGEASFAGWLTATVVVGILVVVLYLTGARKLPIYILEDEED